MIAARKLIGLFFIPIRFQAIAYYGTRHTRTGRYLIAYFSFLHHTNHNTNVEKRNLMFIAVETHIRLFRKCF